LAAVSPTTTDGVQTRHPKSTAASHQPGASLGPSVKYSSTPRCHHSSCRPHRRGLSTTIASTRQTSSISIACGDPFRASNYSRVTFSIATCGFPPRSIFRAAISVGQTGRYSANKPRKRDADSLLWHYPRYVRLRFVIDFQYQLQAWLAASTSRFLLSSLLLAQPPLSHLSFTHAMLPYITLTDRGQLRNGLLLAACLYHSVHWTQADCPPSRCLFGFLVELLRRATPISSSSRTSTETDHERRTAISSVATAIQRGGNTACPADS